MTATLMGRIQTRILLLATVGMVWTLVVSPLLPRANAFATSEDIYRVTFEALFWVVLLGVLVWEPLYHLLQQWRWEKDWPIVIGLLTGITEGIVVWLFMRDRMSGGEAATTGTFVWHFATTWLVVWLVANGPLRAVLVRWRYRGGRIV